MLSAMDRRKVSPYGLSMKSIQEAGSLSCAGLLSELCSLGSEPCLQRIGLGNRGSNLRLRALRRQLPSVLKQLAEYNPASSIRQQNTQSERRERRANQHEHIHCILHIRNTLPDFGRGSLTTGLDAPMRLASPLFLSRCHS